MYPVASDQPQRKRAAAPGLNELDIRIGLTDRA